MKFVQDAHYYVCIPLSIPASLNDIAYPTQTLHYWNRYTTAYDVYIKLKNNMHIAQSGNAGLM